MLRISFFLIIYLFVSLAAYAQDATAIKYAQRISESALRSLLNVLASDSLEGRETGMAGQKKAAAFIAGVYSSAGLQPCVNGGYFQPTFLSARANKGRNFQVYDKYFVFLRDYFYPAGICDSLFVIRDVVFAGHGISKEDYDDYVGLNAENSAVLFLENDPGGKRPKSISQKIIDAKRKGAAVALIITDSLEKRINEYHFGAPEDIDHPIPYAFVTREMSRSFFSTGKQGLFDKKIRKAERTGRPGGTGSKTEAMLSFVKETAIMQGENVLAFLPGTDKKDEVLVVTAHYDHLGVRDSLIYYGADDNASGTSAVIEMARVFSEASNEGKGPRRSILFMTVSGEEKGLLGSRYYVSHPVFPLENTIANLNTDMIGRTDGKHDSLGISDYVYIIGSDKLSTTLHKINENANASFTKLKLDYTYNSPEDPNHYYYRSDHYNFAKNNIPVIFYFNGTHPDYHKPSDTIDKIRFDLIAKRAQLIFLTAWELANREERIRVDVQNNMPVKKDN
jgi:Peptidase family M28